MTDLSAHRGLLLLPRGKLVSIEAAPQGVGCDDEDDRVECEQDQDRDVEVIPCSVGGQEAAVGPYFRSELEHLERVDQEDGRGHQDRHPDADQEVDAKPPVVLLFLQREGQFWTSAFGKAMPST